MTSSVTRKEELEKELQEIKKNEEEEAFKRINECLQKWKVQLDKCSHNKKETSSYEIVLYHYSQAQPRYLQWGGGVVHFTNNKGNADWRIYAKCDTSCTPSRWYANNKEELLPNIPDLYLLSMYGVNFTLHHIGGKDYKIKTDVINKIKEVSQKLQQIKEKVDCDSNSFSNQRYANHGMSLANQDEEFISEILNDFQEQINSVGKKPNSTTINKLQQCLELCNDIMENKTSKKQKK